MSAHLILDRLRARCRGDAGITLTELIVSMGLFSLIGAMTLSIFLSIDNSSTSTVDRTINSSLARNTIQAWTAYLRVADGTTPGVDTDRFGWLTANNVLFYTDLYNRSLATPAVTGKPTMMWLRLDAAGSLVEEQFAWNAPLGAVPTVCRTLATNVTAPALFTPRDSHGNAISTSGGNLGIAPIATTGCRGRPQINSPSAIVQTNLRTITSVEIDFVVRDTRNAHPIEFDSQAVLPKLWS